MNIEMDGFLNNVQFDKIWKREIPGGGGRIGKHRHGRLRMVRRGCDRRYSDGLAVLATELVGKGRPNYAYIANCKLP